MTPLVSHVEHSARTAGRATALIVKGKVVSYEELWRDTLNAAKTLASRGVVKGDRVVLSASSAESFFVAAYLAVHRLGAVAVAVDPQSPQSRRKMIFDAVDPRIVVDSNVSATMPDGQLSFAALVETAITQDAEVQNLGSPPDSEGIADILFTTGTTGRPKGVVLTHRNLWAAARNINQFVGNTCKDLEVVPLPLSHSFGLGRVRCALYAGGGLVLVDGMTFPSLIVRALREYKATGLAVVPSAARILLRLAGNSLRDLRDQLRFIEIGSAPMPEEDKQLICQWLPNTRICMHYGLTEASRSAFTEFHENYRKLSSIGRPSPNVSIMVYKESGECCAANEQGQIMIRGDHVFAGYLDSDKRRLFAPRQGWFASGDYGYFDEDGFLFLSGRTTEFINVGGRKVAPQEVENVLVAFPGVLDCACIGMPDPRGITGEAVKAVCVWNADDQEFPTAREFRQFLNGKLEPFKIPLVYERVAELPRTSSGKLARLALQNRQES